MTFNLAQFGWTPDDIFWNTSFQSLILMLNSMDDRKKLKTPEETESSLSAFFGVNISGDN